MEKSVVCLKALGVLLVVAAIGFTITTIRLVVDKVAELNIILGAFIAHVVRMFMDIFTVRTLEP